MDFNFFENSPPTYNVIDGDDDIPQFPCSYRSPDELKDISNNYKIASFSLLTYNIRSCRKNFGTFFTFLCNLMFRFSLIILVETWLSSSADCGFDIEGYKHVDIYRDNLGGGIKVFYDERFTVEVIDELTFMNACMEVLTFYLIGINFKYIVCSVYRSTGADPVMFNVQFFTNVINKFPSNSKVILTGDLNLNLFNPLRHTYIDVFAASMLSSGFFPVITIPAKINEGNLITPYSLIDQVWVNFMTGSDHDSGVVVFPLTDHFPIYYMFKGDCLGTLKVVESRLIKDDTMLNFITAMSSSDFSLVFDADNLNTTFECFLGKTVEGLQFIFSY